MKKILGPIALAMYGPGILAVVFFIAFPITLLAKPGIESDTAAIVGVVIGLGVWYLLVTRVIPKSKILDP